MGFETAGSKNILDEKSNKVIWDAKTEEGNLLLDVKKNPKKWWPESPYTFKSIEEEKNLTKKFLDSIKDVTILKNTYHLEREFDVVQNKTTYSPIDWYDWTLPNDAKNYTTKKLEKATTTPKKIEVPVSEDKMYLSVSSVLDWADFIFKAWKKSFKEMYGTTRPKEVAGIKTWNYSKLDIERIDAGIKTLIDDEAKRQRDEQKRLEKEKNAVLVGTTKEDKKKWDYEEVIEVPDPGYWDSEDDDDYQNHRPIDDDDDNY